MYKDRIITALLNATLLIVKILKRECTLEEFLNEYGNFYYYEALDGHEADDEQQQVLDEFREIIEFHGKVQMEVVDLVYLDDSEHAKQYINTGRITADQARERLEELNQKYDAEGILIKLSK